MTEQAVKSGHPKGLAVLFTTEMWERFNFYGMRALLSLFIAEALMMGETEASIIYGGFLGLCYLTPMLGGYISDKFLGNRNCIMLGGTMMGIGQLMLFVSGTMYATNLGLAQNVMWLALLAIIFGNGFFKPNISSMVGSLYPPQEKSKLDSAFTIFYLGINVGATLGQIICPIVGDVVNSDGSRNLEAFKWGFLVAAIAMFLGTITFFFLKNKYVVSPDGSAIGGKPSKLDEHEGESTKTLFTTPNIIISMVLLVAGTFGFHLLLDSPGASLIKAWLYPFIFAAGISLGYLILSEKTITKVERDRIWVLYIVCFFVMFFWGAFEQAGSSLTFIANNQTDTRIFGWTMQPSMVQSFNGIFVMVFALPFSFLWAWMNKKRVEPISPVKQAWGLLLIALGYYIIATQVKDLGMAGKIGIIWFVVLYLLHTWGELCLSPIGLSLVAKLAPKRFASLLMGVWFLGNAGGYVLTGVLGALLPPSPDKYIAMTKENVDLKGILEGQVQPTGQQLFILGKDKIGCAIEVNKAKEMNLDLGNSFEQVNKILKDNKDSVETANKNLAEGQKLTPISTIEAAERVLTPEQFETIKAEKLIAPSYPKFFGVKLKDVYDFFMLFVVLCGAAGVVLYALTPIMKRMMHGVR